MERRQFVTMVGLGVGLTPLAGCSTLSGEAVETPTSAGTPTETRTPVTRGSTESPETTETSSETPDPTPELQLANTSTSKFPQPEMGEPFIRDAPEDYRTVEIGSRENVDTPVIGRADGPFHLHIFRYTPTDVFYEIQIVDLQADAILRHEGFTIPAERALHIVFNEPSTYALNLYDHDYDNGWTAEIGKHRFDCNYHRSNFFALDGGDFRWNTLSSRRGC
jgi:hypothetical protein